MLLFRPDSRTWAVLLALVALLGLAMSVGAAHAQFTRFENLTDEQGLGNMTVTAFAQEPDGFILIGTEGGLFRYDGAAVTPADPGIPPGTWIRRIAVDDAGRVWVIGDRSLYLRSGASFRRIDLAGADLGSLHRVAFGRDELVLDRAGTLLHATIHDDEVGPLRPMFDGPDAGDRAAEVSDARFITAIGAGGFLLGCGSGICRLDHDHGGASERFGVAQGLPADRWDVAFRAADGAIWARSLGRLAWRLPGRHAFSSVAIPGHDQRFFSLVPDRLDLVSDGGNGIITQGDEGLLRWDGASWHVITHHSGGLAAAPIQALMFDREDALWVGTLGHGAFRSIGLGAWESWTADDGLTSDLIWAMTRRHDGHLWVATYDDAVTIDGRAPPIPGGSENLGVTRDDRLWLTPLQAPLTRLDPVLGLQRFDMVKGVFSLVVDARNRLLVGTSSGLLMAPDADAPAAAFHLTRALDAPTYALTTDSAGTVWALANGGVFRQNATGRFDQVVKTPAGMDLRVIEFAQPGELWVGTGDNGVFRYRVRGTHVDTLDPIEPPSLASRDISSLHRDRHARMWVGTDRGVDAMDAGTWRHYGASDGLISNDLDEGAVFEDRDGSMWFGTSHGLSHLLDPGRPQPTRTLHPHLTGVSLGARQFSNEPGFIAFRSSADPLTIRFADPDYAVARPIRFRYRMRGLDAGWNETTGHEVRYAGIPPGRFRFEMVAVDVPHSVQSAPIFFDVRVHAPWWRQWWLYAIVSIVLASTLFLAWQLRIRLLLRQQQRLEAMVATRTAEIEQAREELHRLTLTDALTGLPNRRALMAILEQAVTHSAAATTSLGVLLCDIDHFKRINDGFGHLSGDGVLAAFGARLQATLTAPDAAGRYGGEEFCVLLHGAREQIDAKVEAIRTALGDAPFRLGSDTEGHVKSSGGLAFHRPDDTTLSILARADAALYDAKENGRNRVERERTGLGVSAGNGKAARVSSRAEGFDGLLDPLEIALRDDLETALREHQFALHFQPVVDIRHDEVVSCEALIRWHSPTRGRVPPMEFIPFAERVGLMPALGDWILVAACREAATWPDRLVVSVNLSPEQLRLPDLLARVDAALAETGLPAHRLELEITETAMIEDAAAARTVLVALRERGIKIALDDFGTGYSSLSFLRTLSFDRVKIDRSFVMDLDVKPEASVIVRAIVEMSRNLGAAVTAEGVETDEQITLLRAAGCFELQGYRLGRPCAVADLQGRIEAVSAGRRSPASRSLIIAAA